MQRHHRPEPPPTPPPPHRGTGDRHALAPRCPRPLGPPLIVLELQGDGGRAPGHVQRVGLQRHLRRRPRAVLVLVEAHLLHDGGLQHGHRVQHGEEQLRGERQADLAGPGVGRHLLDVAGRHLLLRHHEVVHFGVELPDVGGGVDRRVDLEHGVRPEQHLRRDGAGAGHGSPVPRGEGAGSGMAARAPLPDPPLRDVLEGGEGGREGVWLGPPLLPGSPYGPCRRRAEKFWRLNPLGTEAKLWLSASNIGRGGGGGGGRRGVTPLLRCTAVLMHPCHPPTHPHQKTFPQEKKEKFIKRGRNRRSMLGTQTSFWPLTCPIPPV